MLRQRASFPHSLDTPLAAYEFAVEQTGSARSRVHRLIARSDVMHIGKDSIAAVRRAAPLPIGASAADVDAALDAKAGLFATLWDRLGAKGVKIIQHSLVPPAARYCGIAERLAPAAPANQVRQVNEKLLQTGRGRVHWVDMEALATDIGARNFGATRFWHQAKLDFDQRWLPDYLAPFRAAWRAANARAKKVLVLDLDSTL